jgi:hypothetical protein
MADSEVVKLLRSIDASLKQLARGTAAGPVVADDRDLDGKYGDPVVRFNPRDWLGESFKGRQFSECPAEFLDQLAQAFDYFAKKAEDSNEQYNGKPVAPFKRLDAARARGWAKRNRNGHANTTTGEMREPAGDESSNGAAPFEQSEWPDDSDIPF